MLAIVQFVAVADKKSCELKSNNTLQGTAVFFKSWNEIKLHERSRERATESYEQKMFCLSKSRTVKSKSEHAQVRPGHARVRRGRV